MINPEFQWPTQPMMTCPGCGTNNPTLLPWTESAFILVKRPNTGCPDYALNVLIEKASLTVTPIAQSGACR